MVNGRVRCTRVARVDFIRKREDVFDRWFNNSRLCDTKDSKMT